MSEGLFTVLVIVLLLGLGLLVGWVTDWYFFGRRDDAVNNAARGTRAENLVVDELGACGYDVTRSAASKGAADLVAVHDGEILFVQVKICSPGKSYQQPSPAERRELVRIAGRCGGVPVVAQRHPGSGSRPARTAWYELTGPGPDERRSWIPREAGM